jgi:integrase
MRPLTWSHVDLKGKPEVTPVVPPHIMVWRSVRATGDTKTRKSKRSLALPARCVDALRAQRARVVRLQSARSTATGLRGWTDNDLVFPSTAGTELQAGNVRRAFRRIVKDAGLTPDEWTPRELRHSFVSLLSDDGVPIERISLLVGHSGTTVTEAIYRHQIRPVVQDAAGTIDRLFPAP